jgi:hypothetical protein
MNVGSLFGENFEDSKKAIRHAVSTLVYNGVIADDGILLRDMCKLSRAVIWSYIFYIFDVNRKLPAFRRFFNEGQLSHVELINDIVRTYAKTVDDQLNPQRIFKKMNLINYINGIITDNAKVIKIPIIAETMKRAYPASPTASQKAQSITVTVDPDQVRTADFTIVLGVNVSTDESKQTTERKPRKSRRRTRSYTSTPDRTHYPDSYIPDDLSSNSMWHHPVHGLNDTAPSHHLDAVPDDPTIDFAYSQPPTYLSMAEQVHTADLNTPGANPPGANPPDRNTPGANPPDANTPDVNTPGANTPGANPPDMNTPDANTPGANHSRRESSRHEHCRREHSRREHSRREHSRRKHSRREHSRRESSGWPKRSKRKS